MAQRTTQGVQSIFERNQEATCYIGNLDTQANEELLWELFVQCGPVVNVHVPRDKITSQHQGYAFVEFRSEEDADYAIKIMNMIKLFGKPIRVNKASQDKRTNEVGANLFIGNLDPEVDEKLLYDTFSAFGAVLTTKIMRDGESGGPKGFGFVAYDSFEASDAALNAMNGQFLCNRPIHVSYAYKKDTKGERHGSAAERMLAAQARAALPQRPNQSFAAPVTAPPLAMATPQYGGYAPPVMQPAIPGSMMPMSMPQYGMAPPPPAHGYGMPPMPPGMPAPPSMYPRPPLPPNMPPPPTYA
eukprot:GILK01003292.1.p1 GENE.GILK01003292.1~~GILK01003292.1.p1  ORF type:complete len:313 (-),score=38.01 GILK01003292.1:178-1077(-)